MYSYEGLRLLAASQDHNQLGISCLVSHRRFWQPWRPKSFKINSSNAKFDHPRRHTHPPNHHQMMESVLNDSKGLIVIGWWPWSQKALWVWYCSPSICIYPEEGIKIGQRGTITKYYHNVWLHLCVILETSPKYFTRFRYTWTWLVNFIFWKGQKPSHYLFIY